MPITPDPKPIEPSEEDRKAAADWIDANLYDASPQDDESLALFRAQARDEEASQWEPVVRQLRQKLAIVGVEGSPPPGQTEGTIQRLIRERREADKRTAEERERVIEECAKVADLWGECEGCGTVDTINALAVEIRALKEKA